jgi:hypothetical protein
MALVTPQVRMRGKKTTNIIGVHGIDRAPGRKQHRMDGSVKFGATMAGVASTTGMMTGSPAGVPQQTSSQSRQIVLDGKRQSNFFGMLHAAEPLGGAAMPRSIVIVTVA